MGPVTLDLYLVTFVYCRIMPCRTLWLWSTLGSSCREIPRAGLGYSGAMVWSLSELCLTIMKSKISEGDPDGIVGFLPKKDDFFVQTNTTS